MAISDSTRYPVSWRPLELHTSKAAESYRRWQAQRGKTVPDPSAVRPMEDILEIRSAETTAATYGKGKPAVQSHSTNDNPTPDGETRLIKDSSEVDMDLKVDIDAKQVTVGKVRSGNMQLQGIGYRINADSTLTPFIQCLPADDPNSALPYFEKSIFGTNTDDPYSNIMKHLTEKLPSMQSVLVQTT